MTDRSGTRPVEPPRWLDRAAALSWRFLVVAAALVVLMAVLVRLRLVVIPIVVALFLAALLAPAVEWLRRRGFPSLLATLAVLLAAVLILVGAGWVVTTHVANEFDEVSAAFGEGVAEVEAWLVDGPFGLSPQQLEDARLRVTENLQDRSGRIAGGVMAGALIAVEIVIGLLLTLVLLFFVLKDGPEMVAWTMERVAPGRRDLARALGERSWGTVTGYLRGQALVAAVDAIGIGIGLLIIGVPAVPALVLLTFFAAFFPIVGAIFAGLVASLVALATGGPVDALLVVGVFILVVQLEGNVLEPFVLGRTVRLHPLVVLLALAVGALVGGIFGAFIAIPLAAVLTQIPAEIRERSPSASGSGR